MAAAGSDSTVTDEAQPAASLFSVHRDRREVVAVDADRTAALYFNTGSSNTEKHSTDCWKQTQHTNTVILTDWKHFGPGRSRSLHIWSY